MSNVKDFAANVAAVEPVAQVSESVNAASAANDKPIVDEKALSIETIAKNICKDGHSYIAKTTITNIDCSIRTAANGNEYYNAFINISNPLKGAQAMPDGTRKMGAIGAFQTPLSQLLLVMRKDQFYGRFTNYVGEAAEMNFGNVYLSGITITVLCQFVAAGAQEGNPFTRKDNLYNVVDYDRYVYHIIGVDKPADPVLINAYQGLIKQLMDDARAAIAAKREAKAKATAFASSVAIGDDVPF